MRTTDRRKGEIKTEGKKKGRNFEETKQPRLMLSVKRK